jgi:hypothetical protein
MSEALRNVAVGKLILRSRDQNAPEATTVTTPHFERIEGLQTESV